MEIRKTLRHLMVLGVFALGLPACTGEVVDPDEEKVGQAKEAMCGIDWDCEPPPPPPKPDLKLLPPAGGCELVDPYTIRVTVANTGAAWASWSKTTLQLWTWNPDNGYWEGTVSTPSLPVGATAAVYFYQPFNCHTVGCLIAARADSQNQVSESSESNNHIQFDCF